MAGFDPFAVCAAEPDFILRTAEAFREDPAAKCNLGVGAYRSDDGKPWVLPVVKQALSRITLDDLEYAPIDGDAALKPLTQRVAFGSALCEQLAGRFCSAQALSGTGALRIIFSYLARTAHEQKASGLVYMPNPSWPNHKRIVLHTGLEPKEYRYWDFKARKVDADGMIADLDAAPEGSMVILHACAHNPTGADVADWDPVLAVCERRKLVVIIDDAYQGYATGSLERDGIAMRKFAGRVPLFVAQSFAKNLGLYGERFGMAHGICPNSEIAKNMLSQWKVLIRGLYSSPPRMGARIVRMILEQPELSEMWQADMEVMANRIRDMRKKLADELAEIKTPGDWSHITAQIGMFSYTGLTEKQCRHLTEKWHIYLTMDGRISIASLTSANVKYVAEAIKDAVEHC